VTIARFEADLWANLSALEAELAEGRYLPLPLLRIEVDKGKGNGETRSLSIPAVRDRVAQTAVLHRIEPILEKEFEECSYAHRKGRSVRQAFSSRPRRLSGWTWSWMRRILSALTKASNTSACCF
jgi:RNA-directed DNA polymerase